MKDLVEIWMKGDFNQTSAFELRQAILKHAAYSKDIPIVIYINSYGGQVDALNSILDTIDSVPNKIITVCAGTAMSCGAVLLACGDERYIGANSRAMIHQVSTMAWGTTVEIKNSAKETDKLNNQLMRILAKRTGMPLSEMRALFNSNIDKYLDAKESVKFGLVDKVGVPRVVEKLSYTLE
jgi:ATP-dependent Clp protease protease subunit